MPEAVARSRPRRIGVIGTLVWDTIHRPHERSGPQEEWGGIGYALSALACTLPPGWEVLPLIKVGRDLSGPARHFLAELPRVLNVPGVVVVPEPNNRVELHYRGTTRRSEKLSGGVPPWRWPELAPLASLCDAMYVNFISGFEMELETARALRTGFGGPIYADLHSLFLGLGRRGERVPRPLPRWAEWLECFDAVQMNEDEFELLARRQGDPWALAARVVGPAPKLMTVTLGARGSAWVAAGGFDPDPFRWPESRDRLGVPGPARSGRVELDDPDRAVDPTGCGDVWGATLYARLIAGDSLEAAMGRANEMASRNAGFRGARGLHLHLQGRLARRSEAG